MTIVWKYLDKRSATIEAISDYGSMKFIIDHTDQKIKEEQDRMIGLGAMVMDGMPHLKNPKAGENRVVQGIDEINVLKERYRQAVEYMEWFVPAWKELSEEEQDILETFFGEDNYGDYAADSLTQRYHVSRPTVYRKRDKALDRLTILLFGKE